MGRENFEMMGEKYRKEVTLTKGTRRIWQRLEWLLSDTRVQISIITYLLYGAESFLRS